CAVLERREWTMASHRLIAHGRRTCHARRPACGACAVAPWCASAGIGERDPVAALRLVKESAHVPGQTTSASQLASSRETSSGASSGRK
ncbi:MAG TPA: hypothetical protein PKB06_08170, partial [Actinotalea sp.]|nr:hypothetical protein [Actinotalea sp.]